MLEVRPTLGRILLVRRDRLRGLPDWASSLGGEVEISLADTRGALAEAELLTTATNSRKSVIPAGAETPRLRHVNLVGANHLKRSEIREDFARRCVRPQGFLVVDDPDQAAVEAGDFASLAAAGEHSWESVPSLPAIVADPGRIEEVGAAGLTAFKSVGVGLMDLVIAAGLLARLGLLQLPPQPQVEIL